MITRRTLLGMFLLMPVDWMQELFAYALARASSATGVKVVGGSCMSNHYHVLVVDPNGNLPKFVEILNELLARAGNAEWGRRDHFFESGQANYVELLNTNAVEEALVYALTNPCAARLVARSRAWGGWQSQPETLGTTRRVVRPELVFFSDRSVSPREQELELVVPPTHGSMPREEFQARISRRLKLREDELREQNKGKYLGMDKVLASSPATTAQPVGESRALVPVAKVGRIEGAPEAHREFAEGLRWFWADYRDALRRTRAGESVTFPYGTYRLRLDGVVRCADPP